jgi:glycosyltransferase involved in cell wall biosynthesis
MVGPREAEVSRILTENDAGIVIDIGNANGLMRSIYRLQRDRALCERLGSNARAAFEARHSASVCCNRIRQIIEHAVHRQPQ